MSICELQVVESALPPRATEKWMSPGLMGTEQGVLTLDESPIALNTHTHTHTRHKHRGGEQRIQR